MLQDVLAAPGAMWRAFRGLIDDERERNKLRGVRFGRDVIVRGANRIRVGDNVFIDHRAYVSSNVVGGRRGSISLGSNVEIGPYSVLWGGGGIRIGNNVHIGAHVHITSMQGEQVSPLVNGPDAGIDVHCALVTIEDHVLICSGAVIVPGVTVGHHAMIAAGAVVTDDVPPYALVAGVPARVVRTLRTGMTGTATMSRDEMREAVGETRRQKRI